MADLLVIGLSPILIMMLVGSLSFFLIEVFYQGKMAGGIRWVMFWFVIAIVLVSRIGIEQGAGHATGYGLALATATWLYLAWTHPGYLFGLVLLGVAWWCARQLTRDCTLINEDQDSSSRGVLDELWRWGGRVAARAREEHERDPPASRRGSPRAPGVWVVYFSVAALPIFGVGQTLLARQDSASRRAGFAFLLIYLAAGLGLLVTTSFLGLRRYLRQRYVQMSSGMAIGWMRSGVAIAVAVLIAALFLPRPGSDYTWKTLGYQVDHGLRRASEYAARMNPHGEGEGRAGREGGREGQQGQAVQPTDGPAANEVPEQGTARGERASQSENQTGDSQGQGGPGTAPVASADRVHGWLRGLVVVATGVLAIWWFIRNRHFLLQIVQGIRAGLLEFFRNLRKTKPVPESGPMRATVSPLATFQDPFLSGAEKSWTPEQLIIHTHQALEAWANEHGAGLQPQQTSREFCRDLGEKFPEAETELVRLSCLYGYAVYGRKLPNDYDSEPVRRLWRYISQ